MATVNFYATFDYANSLLNLDDTTDWAGQGISTTDVNGNFKVTLPNGTVFYENNDFSNETATAQSGASTSITLDAGASATTDYYKDLYIKIVSGTGSTQVKKVTAYNGTTKVATVESAWSVTPDNTSVYNFVFADIYIDADLSNQVPISVPLDANNKPLNGTYNILYTVYDTNLATYSTKSIDFEICYQSPTVCIEQTVNCLSPLFQSVDTTVYTVNSVVPTISRTHTLYYPAGTPLINTPTVSTGATISTGVFYTGVQQTQVDTTLQYIIYTHPTDDTNILIYDEVSGSASVDVDCDSRLCDIFCCVITLYNKMNKYKCKNEILYKEALEDFTLVMSLVSLAREAWECGKEDKLNTIITDILNVAECEPGCGCSDGTPQQVTGLGASANFVEVTSGGSPVVLASTVVGNTTTYQVSLSQNFVNKVNNLNSSVVATDTPTFLTVTASGSDPITYTVSFNSSAITDYFAKDETSFRVAVDYTDYLGTFITVSDEEISPGTGSNFQSATVASFVTPANTNTFKNAAAIYSVSDFMVSANDDYKVFVTLVPRQIKTEFLTITDILMGATLAQTFFPQVVYTQSGQFQIVLIQTGKPAKLLHQTLLTGAVKFDLHINIKK